MNMDMAIVIVNEHHDETWASAWDMSLNMDMSTRHGHEHVIETWAAH